jgi:hypothetical protein
MIIRTQEESENNLKKKGKEKKRRQQIQNYSFSIIISVK